MENFGSEKVTRALTTLMFWAGGPENSVAGHAEESITQLLLLADNRT